MFISVPLAAPFCYPRFMHRALLICVCAALLLCCGAARGADYKLADGTVITGELVSPNDKGVVLKAEDKLSARILWTNFSPETLKEFQGDPKLKNYVDVLLAPPAPTEKEMAAAKKAAKKKASAAAAKDFVPPERPELNASIAGGLTSPIGLVSLALLVLAHAYAGFEIARYRNRPPILICSISLIPILGPIICICLPTAPRENEAEAAAASKPAHQPVLPSAIAAAAEAEARAQLAASQPPRTEPEPPTKPPATVYQRGEFTFNRRFFETKLAGFARLIPGEAEKSLEMVFLTARGDFVSRRISKFEAEWLLLAIQKDDAFYEEKIPYIEIREVHVRPREETTA